MSILNLKIPVLAPTRIGPFLLKLLQPILLKPIKYMQKISWKSVKPFRRNSLSNTLTAEFYLRDKIYIYI